MGKSPTPEIQIRFEPDSSQQQKTWSQPELDQATTNTALDRSGSGWVLV